jgi:bile acid-coenzyme A ligase
VGFEPDPSLDDSPLPEAVSPSWKAASSGGSTGRPKIVVSGQSGLVPRSYGAPFLMEPDDVHIVPGPLYHNAPFSMSFSGLIMGQHLVVLPRFDADAALDAVERHRVTWANFVPTMLQRMLRSDRIATADLSSIRVLWHMAAPCAPWVKEAWIERVGADKVYEMYGGTEGQALTMITGTEWLAHRGSVGRPLVGGVRVLGDQGEDLAPGDVGEIYLRRPDGRPETYRYIGAEARTRDGWESLGDLGWLDEDGYLYLSDRRTDLVLSGGANVYPAEVELAVEEHPKVLSCVVVGLPDDDLGQRVHAVVQTADGVLPDDLEGFLRARLVTYKLPRSYDVVTTPLRDDAGKVRRSAVREDAVRRLSLT